MSVGVGGRRDSIPKTTLTRDGMRSLPGSTRARPVEMTTRNSPLISNSHEIPFLFFHLIECLFRKLEEFRTSRTSEPLRSDFGDFQMLLISMLYAWMFVIIRNDRQHARPVTLKRREDSVLAFRFFLIVLTDCLCWIPIIVIKLAALCNVKISRKYLRVSQLDITVASDKHL